MELEKPVSTIPSYPNDDDRLNNTSRFNSIGGKRFISSFIFPFLYSFSRFESRSPTIVSIVRTMCKGYGRAIFRRENNPTASPPPPL